jgi:hypothetical protein
MRAFTLLPDPADEWWIAGECEGGEFGRCENIWGNEIQPIGRLISAVEKGFVN